MLDKLQELIRPLYVMIANSIARGVVQVIDDSKKQQLLQLGIQVGEDVDEAERFQQYGFSSVPLAGAEAVVLFPGGDRSHPLVVAVDDRRHRPTSGLAGEVMLYTDEGDVVKLGRGNIIELGTAGRVEVKAAGAGALAVTDELVHGTGIDPFTGSTYKVLGNTSSKIRAAK